LFVVDTNILVYAINQDSPHSDACFARLQEWSHQVSAWFLTWGICYEFLRVVTHARVLSSPWTVTQGWGFLEELLHSPGLSILGPTERHAEVLAQVLKEVPTIGGNRMYDAQTAVLMREHGVRRIYTRDTDFHRFPFLEPVDPMVQQV
jgi:toxin-antitoxin system PIN domain toxin